MMKTGMVWLVGAGPGDGGLLTVKGARVLSQAEVVVYDALVGGQILAQIPAQAQKIYVGKRAGMHAMAQEDINACLVRCAKEGRLVVRLKGGDPFLFGRGGEEVQALCAAGLPYEIVPGVPSALAVPAYCGIPVTHRDYCSSVHVIAAHKRAGEELALDFDALCRLDGTLVFLMGVAALPDICAGLLRAGMRPDTPAALLSQGTTASQKKLVSTLEELPHEALQHPLATPAVIIVGKVCGLAGTFAWYEKQPLFGVKILLTAPAGRSERLSERLRMDGAQVIELPTIALEPVELTADAMHMLDAVERYQWLVFSSPSGVEQFFARCADRRIDLRRLRDARFAVLGAGTARALAAHGFYAELMPQEFSGEALGGTLAARLQSGERVLVPRAKKGRRELMEKLRAATGVTVDELPLYDTVFTEDVCVDVARVFSGDVPSIAVFTSPLAVHGFLRLVPQMQPAAVHAACIGHTTYAEAQAAGMTAYQAKEPSQEALYELINYMAKRG